MTIFRFSALTSGSPGKLFAGIDPLLTEAGKSNLGLDLCERILTGLRVDLPANLPLVFPEI